jgi:hypothetical protein
MKTGAVVLLCFTLALCAPPSDDLVYHAIQTDRAGMILPWYSPEPGIAYDQVIRSVWSFWHGMESCPNGVKYYLQHQVWSSPDEDSRGLGGDQLAMALSSWSLLYPYLGDSAVLDDMRYIADYYIEHGLSRPQSAWPNLPYPYNSSGVHTGVYDGDMKAGKGFLQPDKAGSFAAELLTLFEMTGTERYLKTALAIADTLAAKVVPGDSDNSPWPYRVHAENGKVSLPYTTNWTGTLRLFEELIRLRQGNAKAYGSARNKVIVWLKTCPMRTNKWGPFFEDVPGWSDSEINADSLAFYILEHPDWGPDWRQEARALLDWSRMTFGNHSWSRYGVTAINEQTAYRVPGNSHTSRHASVQIAYCEKTGDLRLKDEAIRQLNWATYMVDRSGRNRYPYDDVWLTDGYGDYVRHYLRAMASAPELAPAGQDHLLRSTAPVRTVVYEKHRISYSTFDGAAREVLRISFVPGSVAAGGVRLERVDAAMDLDRGQGYCFEALGQGGVLRVRHDTATDVVVTAEGPDSAPGVKSLDLLVPQNEARRIRLEVSSGVQGVAGISFRTGKPSHGNLSGSAPDLVYTPEPDYQGDDVFSYWARYGNRETAPAQVRITVVRTNLARVAGVVPFTTESPQSGASGVFALLPLIDDDVITSVNAGTVLPSSREVAIGILWPGTQKVRQIVLRQGSSPAHKADGFSLVELQTTSDGIRWEVGENVSVVPGPNGPWADGIDAIFTLADPVAARGIRIVGNVPASGVARIRELQVYPGLASARAPKIEYHPVDRSVAAGEPATFGVRTDATALLVYTWQRSIDGGVTWTDVPGAHSSFYLVGSANVAEHNGNQFRCVVSNGTPPDAVSRAALLTVK